MKIFGNKSGKWFLGLCTGLCILGVEAQQNEGAAAYKLIAHRGGVVDDTRAENSMEALQEAYRQGYRMVEIDLRLTRDSVFITHHDRDLKRFNGGDRTIATSTWAELKAEKGFKGNPILLLDEVLAYCQGRLDVMIDNKIPGDDPVLFGRLIALLRKYGLAENALMIGTDDSTEFFTGKIRLSCTRAQLEANIQRPDYKASHYYLFAGDIPAQDAAWARDHDIMTVGVINTWGIKRKATDYMALAKEQAERMQAAGIDWYQIDSEFYPLFSE